MCPNPNPNPNPNPKKNKAAAVESESSTHVTGSVLFYPMFFHLENAVSINWMDLKFYFNSFLIRCIGKQKIIKIKNKDLHDEV